MLAMNRNASVRSVKIPHLQRVALLDALLTRFYVDQPATLITNGLSTELLVFPGDLNPKHPQVLKRKIDRAISYATAFSDVPALNALLHISKGERSNILALGLYLYFADECSRLCPKTTFLTALRDAGVALKSRDVVEPEALFHKLSRALSNLHMGLEHQRVLREWHEAGTYTIQGIRHAWDKDGNVLGAYSKLAQNIVKSQDYLAMNKAVSYALGNKRIAQHQSAQETYAMTESIVSPGHMGQISVSINQGDGIRRRRLYQNIARADIKSMATKPSDTVTARAILSHIPNAVLEILLSSNYTIAYVNDTEIRKSYPQQNDITEISETAERHRRGIALRLSRFDTIFLSNGNRDFSRGGDDLKCSAVAQSLLHEAMHIIISHLDVNQRNALREAVESIHEEIQLRGSTLPLVFHNKLKTLDRNTLRTVIDYQSDLYNRKGYSFEYDASGRELRPDSRWEEVVCNLFGVIHTEFSEESGTPFSGFSQHLATLQKLQDKIAQAVNKALENCRASSSATFSEKCR